MIFYHVAVHTTPHRSHITPLALRETTAHLSFIHSFIPMASSEIKGFYWVEISPLFCIRSRKGEYHSTVQVTPSSCENAAIIHIFGTEVIQNRVISYIHLIL